MYQKDILSNGFRVVSFPMQQRESISLGFWIGAGGRYETHSQKGIAHFLEHIVFKGSQKYACSQIKEKIEGVGGSLNAFTSEEQTCFYAKIPHKHFEKTFDILADLVFFPKILPKDVDKERAVIIEEIKMYNDMPQYYVLDLLDRLLWPEHPLGQFLAGSADTVSKLQSVDLKEFHQKFYGPSNVVFSVAGAVQHKKTLDLLKQKLGECRDQHQPDFLRVGPRCNLNRISFFKKDIEQMHIALGMHAYDENHKDRYALNILNTILGGNMSSRLFVEIREKKGMAYSIGSTMKCYHDTGLFMVRAGVDRRKAVKAVELIVKELDKIRRLGVKTNEFKRAKEYMVGQLTISLEDTMEQMLWMGEGLIAKNRIRTAKEVLKEFEKVTEDDIKRVAADIFAHKNQHLSIVGPLKSSDEAALKGLLHI